MKRHLILVVLLFISTELDSLAQSGETYSSKTDDSSFFSLPPDTPISLKSIPPTLSKEIVARVGEGGVTHEEFEEAKRQFAYTRGLNEASDIGYSVKQITLSSQEEANALWNSIDEEILFQGAIDDKAFESDFMMKRVQDEFYSKLSIMPEVKREKEDPFQFKSLRKPDLSEFSENRILTYYQTHPEQFQAPVRVRVKHIDWPSNADEGGMGERHLESARRNPEGTQEWQGDEWVTEGYTPLAVRDGSLAYDLPKLFQTPKGSVSPILHATVYMYIFWVIDRQESSGLRHLEEVKDLVLHQLAQIRLKAYSEIREKDSERFYRMALHMGIHRTLKSEVNSRFLTKFYNPPPGRKREDILAELREKYPVEIVLKDTIYAKDQRKEYWKKKRQEEEEAMMPTRLKMSPLTAPEKTGDPEIDQLLDNQAKGIKQTVILAFAVAAIGILVWFIRYFRS